MDTDLWTYAEAGRRTGLSERTIRRWVSEGLLRRYWWPVGAKRQGPRVSAADLVRVVGGQVESETSHGHYEFRVNRPRRGLIEIWNEAGEKVGNAAVYLDAGIDWAAPHPDGLLIESAGTLGKVTRNDEGTWCFSIADELGRNGSPPPTA
jgi:hypothetical protein